MLSGHDQVCVFTFFLFLFCGGDDFLPLGNQKKQAADRRMGGFFFGEKGQSQISLRKKSFEIVRVRQ
jgi:hypothetical protein